MMRTLHVPQQRKAQNLSIAAKVYADLAEAYQFPISGLYIKYVNCKDFMRLSIFNYNCSLESMLQYYR